MLTHTYMNNYICSAIHLVLHNTQNCCEILEYYFYLVKGHNSSKTKWNVTKAIDTKPSMLTNIPMKFNECPNTKYCDGTRRGIRNYYYNFLDITLTEKYCQRVLFCEKALKVPNYRSNTSLNRSLLAALKAGRVSYL